MANTRYRIVLNNTQNYAELEDDSAHKVYLWSEDVSEGAIFYQNAQSPTKVYTFEVARQVSTLRYIDTQSATDIATTPTRLWLSSGGQFREFIITLVPFSLTFNRVISTGTSIGVGLCAINNTTLIGSVGTNITSFNITGSTAIRTTLFSMGTDRRLTGDIIYNPDLDRYIVTHHNGETGTDFRITEYAADGTVLFDRNVVANRYGIFVENGILYAGGYDTLYRITADADVYIGRPFDDTVWMNGASQYTQYTNYSFVG